MMWLPPTAVAVDHFHLVSLANQAVTEARQNLSSRSKDTAAVASTRPGRTACCSCGPVTSSPILQTRRLAEVFAADDPTGKLQAVWKAMEQLKALLRTGSLAHAAVAKEELKILVKAAGRPKTNKLYRTVCRCWNEIEVPIVTGATTPKWKPTTPTSNTPKGLVDSPSGRTTTTNREEPFRFEEAAALPPGRINLGRPAAYQVRSLR